MSKILMLQGPPACGKSTFAREFIQGKKDWVIVSRDSIREGRGDYWIPEQEDFITKLEEYQLNEALRNGYNVIVDATNLDPKKVEYIKKLSEQYKTELEIKPFYIPYKEALKRDMNPDRKHPVGRKILLRFYSKYYPTELAEEIKDSKLAADEHFKSYNEPENMHKPSAIIVDLDGTIALHTGRTPFEWSRVNEDVPYSNLDYILCTLLYGGGFELIFVTGRPEQAREKTKDWIETNLLSIKYWSIDENGKDLLTPREYKLIMRRDDDNSHGYDFKKKVYEEQIQNDYNVVAVFDDSRNCCEMYRKLGLLVCQVDINDY